MEFRFGERLTETELEFSLCKIVPGLDDTSEEEIHLDFSDTRWFDLYAMVMLINALQCAKVRIRVSLPRADPDSNHNRSLSFLYDWDILRVFDRLGIDLYLSSGARYDRSKTLAAEGYSPSGGKDRNVVSLFPFSSEHDINSQIGRIAEHHLALFGDFTEERGVADRTLYEAFSTNYAVTRWSTPVDHPV